MVEPLTQMMTRRDFLKLSALALAGAVLDACAPASIPPSPNITPAITPSRPLTKEQLKNFSGTIGSIYKDAYGFAKEKSVRPLDSLWTKEEIANVWRRLSYLTEQLPSSFSGGSDLQQLSLRIREKAFNDYFDPLVLQYGGMFMSPPVEVKWIARVQAMKDILEKEKGVVVHPIIFGWPPTISISTDVETEMARQAAPMEVSPFPVNIHHIRKENIIIDTHTALQTKDENGETSNWKRPVASVTYLNGKREIYIYDASLQENTDALLAIGSADEEKPKPFRDTKNNPPEDDIDAIKIFNTAQRLINSTVEGDRAKLIILQEKGVIAHESAHLMETHTQVPHFEEARSYLEELRSKVSGVPRLALARMLYEISSKKVIDYVKEKGKYIDNPNTAGMQLIIGDLVEAISKDATILQKIDAEAVKSVKGGSVNQFLPAITTIHGNTIVDILTKMDKLGDDDLNKLAETIRAKRKKDLLVYHDDAQDKYVAYWEREAYRLMTGSNTVVATDYGRRRMFNPTTWLGLAKAILPI